MNKTFHIFLAIIALLFSYSMVYSGQASQKQIKATSDSSSHNPKIETISSNLSSAIFAGGCFWCVESDFEELEGVSEAISGYTGGKAETANYKTVSKTETGHYEAVQVIYDPSIVSYSELVEFFWRTIDPTDPDGQFCDKGSSYRTAIFYTNEYERNVLEKSLAQLKQNKPFTDAIVTPILPETPFYEAEKYHQNYYKKNPIRYKYYRNGCRRDKTLKKLWGEN